MVESSLSFSLELILEEKMKLITQKISLCMLKSVEFSVIDLFFFEASYLLNYLESWEENLIEFTL